MALGLANIVSDVISLAAAGFAFWQAGIARTQSKIGRETLALQREEQRKADAPRFKCSIRPPGAENGAGWAVVRMTDGSAVDVKVSISMAGYDPEIRAKTRRGR